MVHHFMCGVLSVIWFAQGHGLKMGLAFSHVYGVKVFKDEIFSDQLLDGLVLVEGEKPLGLIGVILPNPLAVLAAVHTVEEQPVRLQHAADLYEDVINFRPRDVE